MKTAINIAKIFILAQVVFLVQSISVFSQGTDSRSSSGGEKVFAGLSVSPLQTSIVNGNVPSIYNLDIEKKGGLNIVLDFGYFFSEMAGISIGAGYVSYSSKAVADSCSIKFSATDNDVPPEEYQMRISGKALSEVQKISFLSIPVCIVLKFPLKEKLGFTLKGGVSFDIPLNNSYNGIGTFSYDGYYSAYPVLIQNAPLYGFPSNLQTPASGKLLINSFNLGITATGGGYYFINEYLQLIFGIQYNKSIGNISGYKPNAEFRLTSKANELNSLMAGSPNAGVQALGLSLGIRYFLR